MIVRRGTALVALAVACACRRHTVTTAADVASRVAPSVVNVFSGRDAGSLNLGSGVIMSANGMIVTNCHVIDGADAVAVVLADGRELPATIVASDARSDIAVLRVDAHDLTPIPVGDSSKLRVGDVVLAFGNPFGLGQTVTMGIVSATGRSNLGISEMEDFIQTDAAINPGNSGGALVDMQGELVGLNTAIVSRTGGYQGIGFAIPSNIVASVEAQLVRHGKVTRGWFGAIMENERPRHGVLVSAVAPDSPASRAGISRGDVIVAFAGIPVHDVAHLRNLVALAGPIRVHVSVERNGRVVERDVALVEER